MKTTIRLLILGGLLLSGCQEDPIIQAPGFQCKPVIYSIIDSDDTVHLIRLTRFFSGAMSPPLTARIADSVYFKDAVVKVALRDLSGRKVNVPVEYFAIPDKKPGIFDSENSGAYRFRKKITGGEFPFKFLYYDSVYIEVDIPGLPAARCSTSMVWPPRIWSPFGYQQYIYMVPDNPMRVLWSGDAWNEIDVNFEVKEELPDTTLTRTFYIQKTNDIHWNGKYYEIKVPYELVVDILNLNLKVRGDVIRRYFGNIGIDIQTGNRDFDIFMKFRDGINDFNYNPYFNVDNGIGMISGKSSTSWSGLRFDLASRLKFASEPVLRKYNFIEN
jgi:hypothetical protein